MATFVINNGKYCLKVCISISKQNFTRQSSLFLSFAAKILHKLSIGLGIVRLNPIQPLFNIFNLQDFD